MNKVFANADEAIADIKDGSVLNARWIWLMWNS